MKMSDREFYLLAEYLQKTSGIHLTLQKKNLLLTRMAHVIEKKGFDSFSAYYDFLKKDQTGNELSDFVNRISTNHTYFFREEEHFNFLMTSGLKQVKQMANATRDIRIWSAGCSNGAEPYTLAMLLEDYLGEESLSWDKKILATDISGKVLAQAQTGIYPERDLEKMPSLWRMKYFEKSNSDHYQVKQTIRNEVIYRRFNLLSPFPFKQKFHMIFCRNVMIYFDEPTKNELIQKFHNHLETGGYLFVGHSETIDRSSTTLKYVMPSVYRRDD